MKILLIGLGFIAMTSGCELEVGKKELPSFTFEYSQRPELCAPLALPMSERKWSEEFEVYLPLDLAWMDCMGVGKWTSK